MLAARQDFGGRWHPPRLEAPRRTEDRRSGDTIRLEGSIAVTTRPCETPSTTRSHTPEA
jgi:hypothetical protein